MWALRNVIICIGIFFAEYRFVAINCVLFVAKCFDLSVLCVNLRMYF